MVTEPKPTVFDQRDSMDDQLHQEDTQHAESVILPIQYVAEESEFIGSEEAEEKEHSMANKSTEIQGSISCYELIQPLVCNENSPVELLRCEDGLQHFVFEPGENVCMRKSHNSTLVKTTTAMNLHKVGSIIIESSDLRTNPFQEEEYDMILTSIKVQGMKAWYEPTKPLIMVWFNGHFQGLIGLIYEVLDREKLVDLGQNVEALK